MEDSITLDDIHNNLGRYIKISREETQDIFSHLDPTFISNRDFLLKQGDVCNTFNMVSSGCLCNYYTDESGIDHVLQFATKMWWTADLDSLIHEKPSTYNIRAIGDCTVLQMSMDTWESLNNKIPQFERYFRIIFQNALITHQKRIIQNISKTADQRYLKFRKDYPELENIVPLKYIASYLGITPEFLSKIRRDLANPR